MIDIQKAIVPRLTEADDVFDVVDERKIQEMRKGLNARYGFGKGKFATLDDCDSNKSGALSPLDIGDAG